MSLSDLSSLGSFVSGVAVLLSLVFLYFQLRQLNAQVRQAERNQQAAIALGRTNRSVDIIMGFTNPALAEASLKGFAGAPDMSDLALHQFTMACRSTFYGWEDAFYQHRASQMDEQAFRNLEVAVEGAARGIGWRTQWRMQRKTFGSEFSDWVDRWMAKTTLVENANAVTAWQAALVAEHAGAAY
jgi:hypothetical protein